MDTVGMAGPASVAEGFFRSLIVVHRLYAHLFYNGKAIAIFEPDPYHCT